MSRTNKKAKNNNAESETTDMKTFCSPVMWATSNICDASPRVVTTSGKSKSVLGSSKNGDFLQRETNIAKSKSTSTKRKRSDGSGGRKKKGFDVMSKWLNYYADEETDVEVKPLINKRTERRKKQKIWKEQALQIEEPVDYRT